VLDVALMRLSRPTTVPGVVVVEILGLLLVAGAMEVTLQLETGLTTLTLLPMGTPGGTAAPPLQLGNFPSNPLRRGMGFTSLSCAPSINGVHGSAWKLMKNQVRGGMDPNTLSNLSWCVASR
jgi:hypothetical protein